MRFWGFGEFLVWGGFLDTSVFSDFGFIFGCLGLVCLFCWFGILALGCFRFAGFGGFVGVGCCKLELW